VAKTFRELLTSTKELFHLNVTYYAEPIVYVPFGSVPDTVDEVLVSSEGEIIISQDGEEINFGLATDGAFILVAQDGTTVITQDELNTIGVGDLVIRTINVHIVEEESLEFEGEDTEDRVRQIKVKTLKNSIKGILRPCIGDQLIRLPQYDEDQNPYTYQGEHSLESIDSWRLTFERKRRDAQGFR
jgi:hypothetical protein